MRIGTINSYVTKSSTKNQMSEWMDNIVNMYNLVSLWSVIIHLFTWPCYVHDVNNFDEYD